MNRADNVEDSPDCLAPPRGFYTEATSRPVELMLVAKNPGHLMPEEMERYRGKPPEAVANAVLTFAGGVFAQQLGERRSSTFHRNIRKYVARFLDVSEGDVFRHGAYTNLVKCSSPGERNRLHSTTMEECFVRHFVRELDYFQPRILIAFGREVEKFLRRHASRHSKPVVYVKHPSYFYRKDQEDAKLTSIREEITKHLNR